MRLQKGSVTRKKDVLRSSEIDADDDEWSRRCIYWQKNAAPESRDFANRKNARRPLILNGHGVKLRVDRGSLLVQNGFTHFPQSRETWRLFPGDWRLPSRIVILDADGSLTLNAFAWLSKQDVPLVMIDWRGDVQVVYGNAAQAVDPELAARQLEAQKGPQRLKISVRLVQEKTRNCIRTLRRSFPTSPAVITALEKIENEEIHLRDLSPTNLSQLLGIEGRIGLAYFRAWRGLPIKWKNENRHPIPDDWHSVGQRSSKASTKSRPNRHATHPVNAILNYAYAVLESQVRMQIAVDGLDRKIGFMHGSYRDKDSLVYDLMEPLRPVVDRQVLRLLHEEIFSPGDFTLNEMGVCRLNPQLARALVKYVTNGGIDSTTSIRGFL